MVTYSNPKKPKMAPASVHNSGISTNGPVASRVWFSIQSAYSRPPTTPRSSPMPRTTRLAVTWDTSVATGTHLDGRKHQRYS